MSVFTGKGLCTECHVVTDTGAADLTRRFAITPVSINDHYLPQGQFPHGKHKSHDGKTGQDACTACHRLPAMKCPFCADPNTQVTDTRENEDGDVVRRRRRCVKCDKRFTTYERAEIALPAVVKKDGARVEFDHRFSGNQLALLNERVENIFAACHSYSIRSRRAEA